MPKTKEHSDTWIEIVRGTDEFIVVEKETEDNPEEGRLRCPRKFCEGEFVVNREKFKGHHNGNFSFAKKCCPYCFLGSFIPGRREQYLEEEGIED